MESLPLLYFSIFRCFFLRVPLASFFYSVCLLFPLFSSLSLYLSLLFHLVLHFHAASIEPGHAHHALSCANPASCQCLRAYVRRHRQREQDGRTPGQAARARHAIDSRGPPPANQLRVSRTGATANAKFPAKNVINGRGRRDPHAGDKTSFRRAEVRTKHRTLPTPCRVHVGLRFSRLSISPCKRLLHPLSSKCSWCEKIGVARKT